MPVQNQSNLNYNILGYNCKQLQYKEKQENDKSRDSTYPEGRRGQPSGESMWGGWGFWNAGNFS